MAHERPTDETRSTRSVAAAHVHGRPGYPSAVVPWMVPGRDKTVLEIGAGIGKLTEQLTAAGHAVHSIDTDPAMLEILRNRIPQVAATQGVVEDLTLPHRSLDAVVCSTAFTALDLTTALPVIAKALKTGGHLSVVWHERDTKIPWVRRLGAFLEGPVGARDNEPSTRTITERLMHSPLFSFVEEQTFTIWQDIDRATVADLVLSRSWVAGLSPEARARAVAEVQAFYADYGRGMDGMQLPYRVHCVRTQVVHQPGLFDDGTDVFRSGNDEVAGESSAASAGDNEGGDKKDAPSRFRFDADLFLSDGTDTDMLLIDFK